MSFISVFVMSCDRTADVARHFVAGFAKYWPNCPYTIYFGVNHANPNLQSIGATPLASAVHGWRQETLEQLDALRASAPGVTHALVFLDDFILDEQVDTARIEKILSDAAAQNVAYLRLRRPDESIWSSLKQRFTNPHDFGGERCIEIRRSHPYYSSLCVALWRLDYLYACVERAGGIWDFERLADPAIPHYSVLTTRISYRHIVEKGQWDTFAEGHCLRAIGWFCPGDRPRQDSSKKARIGFCVGWLRFRVFGYLPMKLKQRFLAMINGSKGI